MNPKRLALLALTALGSAVLTSAGALALTVRNQETPMTAKTAEHEVLMQRVGTWDCEMKLWPAPGEPMLATGTEVARAVGDLHVVSDFTSEMMGMPFEGHGIASWDPTKKRFVSIWVDSVEPMPAVLDGTYDAATKTMTFVGDGRMMGQTMKVRQVVTTKDADHRSFGLYFTPPGGEEAQSMQIEYTRRK